MSFQVFYNHPMNTAGVVFDLKGTRQRIIADSLRYTTFAVVLSDELNKGVTFNTVKELFVFSCKMANRDLRSSPNADLLENDCYSNPLGMADYAFISYCAHVNDGITKDVRDILQESMNSVADDMDTAIYCTDNEINSFGFRKSNRALGQLMAKYFGYSRLPLTDQACDQIYRAAIGAYLEDLETQRDRHSRDRKNFQSYQEAILAFRKAFAGA